MKLVSWNVNGLRSLANNGYWEAFLRGREARHLLSPRDQGFAGPAYGTVPLPRRPTRPSFLLRSTQGLQRRRDLFKNRAAESDLRHGYQRV